MKIFFLVILNLLMTPVFAWFCPGGFQQIDSGDTIDQVIQQCGAPASQTKSTKSPKVPQDWQYYVNFNNPYQSTYTPSTGAPQQASVKMTVTFVKGKVINITVRAQSLTSTGICGATISTGDTDKSIEKACGKPTVIQKQESSDEKSTEVVELKYNAGAPNTLVFENGILVERK